METWGENRRHDVAMVDIDTLVPKERLLRKIERVMDYE